MDAIRLVESESDIRNALTLLFYATLVRLSWRLLACVRSDILARRTTATIPHYPDPDPLALSPIPTVAFLVLMMIIPFLPATNLRN